MILREKMEILIFAFIASYNACRQQERVVAESQQFQPFDLQALRNPARKDKGKLKERSGHQPGYDLSGLGSVGGDCERVPQRMRSSPKPHEEYV
jgi:hypothetical protein